MTSDHVSEFFFFMLCGILGLGFRIAADRTGQARSVVRSQYVRVGLPIIWRSAPALAQIWAPAGILLAFAAVVPRPMGQWLFLPVLILGACYLVAAYWWPMRFVPPWLREEIGTGATPIVGPNRFDWTIFWIAMAAVAVAILGLPFAIIGSTNT